MQKPVEQEKEIKIDEAIGESQVIIVDDDPGFSFMLKDYLLTAGEIRCELFKSGSDFLKGYRNSDSRKIILDYEFDKGPNGLEVLKKIKMIPDFSFPNSAYFFPSLLALSKSKECLQKRFC